MPAVLIERRSASLVGRDAELDRLRAALRAAAAGEGAMVVLRGEAGSGKTRLAGELAAEARAAGSPVLRGRASDVAVAAYRPFSEALLGASRQGLLTGDAEELLPFRAALGLLLPQWREPQFVVSEQSHVVVAEALLRLLAAMATAQPAVLVLEDLHWADPDSLAIVDYLADNLGDTRVLCLATARTGLATPGARTLEGVVRRRSAASLDLQRLPDTAMLAMARAILGGEVSDAVAGLAVRRAEGLPFLLEEVLAASVEAGELQRTATGWAWQEQPTVVPASVAGAVQRRVAGLPPHAARVVHAAAVEGGAADPARIAAALGMEDAEVLDALRRAVDADLLRPERGGYVFLHALVREAVEGDLATVERQRLAAALAGAAEAGDAQLAFALWRLAGDSTRAAHAAITAARQAIDAGALSTAVQLAGEVARLDGVALGDVVVADEVLAAALSMSGEWQRLFEVGNRLLAVMAETGAAAPRRAMVHVRLARAALAAGMQPLAQTHLSGARALLPGNAAVDVLDAAVALESHRVEEARSAAQRALAASEAGGPFEVACEAMELLGRIERLHDVQAALAWFGRQAALAERHGLALWSIRARHEIGIVEMLLGMTETLERTRELAMRAGLLAIAVDVDHQLAGVHVFRLEPESLVAAAERAVQGARQLRQDQGAAMALLHLATGHAMRGRRDQAERLVAEALESAPHNPDVEVYAWAQVRALPSLLHEQRDAAAAEVQRAVELALQHPASPPGAHWALWPLLRALDGGDAEAVETVRARMGGSLITQVYVACSDAVLAGARGHADAAQAAMARADALAADADWTMFLALGRRLVAEAALRDGWADPAPWLREMLPRFGDAGFPAVAAACRDLLRQAGAAVPRPRASSVEVPAHLSRLGVTGREAEVMRLVVAGLSNAEIATRLVVSVRTVEKHVESLLGKTGAASRRELDRLAT